MLFISIIWLVIFGWAISYIIIDNKILDILNSDHKLRKELMHLQSELIKAKIYSITPKNSKNIQFANNETWKKYNALIKQVEIQVKSNLIKKFNIFAI